MARTTESYIRKHYGEIGPARVAEFTGIPRASVHRKIQSLIGIG
ncbi:MAG: helix-turn-helix domain-containing protein [Deltaproteobacteria bacterium]